MAAINWKNIGIFTAGGICGAIAGIQWYKKTEEQNFEERLNEELESMKEYEARKRGTKTTDIDSEDEAVIISCDLAVPEEDKEPEEDIEEEDDEEDEQYYPTRYGHCAGETVVTSKPYIINVDQFTSENDHFDKITLYYYTTDEVLADEEEEIIDDVNGTIGDSTLNCFGYDSDDDDIVYVRNEKLGADYEVIRIYKSFSQDVLGIGAGE